MEPQPRPGQRLYGKQSWRAWCGGVSILVWLLWGCTVAAEVPSAELFPVPDVLRPSVSFWKKIFAEVEVTGGLLHDMKDPSIIYETLEQLPSNSQERQSTISGYRDYYQVILFTLASGKRQDLSQDEARVLAMFQGKDSSEMLHEAAASIRFQGGMRERFMRGIVRSGAYRPEMERIFAAFGLPIELTYLPHVESSFENRALSKAGAAGVWQIMPATGRRFLTVNGRVDERLNIQAATVAAAQIFQENYEQLGTWPLAITAYNHGLYGMKQAVETMGTQDFGVIFQSYRGPLFGFASQNFYAEFLAALDVAQNATRYFGDLPVEASVPFSTMAYGPRDSSAYEERTTTTTPSVVTPPPPLREPPVVEESRQAYLSRPAVPLQSRDTVAVERAPVTILAPTVPRQSRESSDTRTTILVPYNPVAPQVRESAGSEDRGSRATSNAAMARQTRDPVVQEAKQSPPLLDTTVRQGRAPMHENKPAEAVPTSTYRVQPGDTLTTIAQRFRTTVTQLSAWNHLPPRYMVKKGETLVMASPAAEGALPEKSTRQVVAKAAAEDETRKPAVEKTGKRSGDNAALRAMTSPPPVVAAGSASKATMAMAMIPAIPSSAGASSAKVSVGRSVAPEISAPVAAMPVKAAPDKAGASEVARSNSVGTSKSPSASTAKLVAIRAPMTPESPRPTMLTNVTKTPVSTRVPPRRAHLKGV